jgi:hypothetical protein
VFLIVLQYTGPKEKKSGGIPKGSLVYDHPIPQATVMEEAYILQNSSAMGTVHVLNDVLKYINSFCKHLFLIHSSQNKFGMKLLVFL